MFRSIRTIIEVFKRKQIALEANSWLENAKINLNVVVIFVWQKITIFFVKFKDECMLLSIVELFKISLLWFFF